MLKKGVTSQVSNNKRFKTLVRVAPRGTWLFLYPKPHGSYQVVRHPHRDKLPSKRAAEIAALKSSRQALLIQIASEYELLELEELRRRVGLKIADLIGRWV